MTKAVLLLGIDIPHYQIEFLPCSNVVSYVLKQEWGSELITP